MACSAQESERTAAHPLVLHPQPLRITAGVERAEDGDKTTRGLALLFIRSLQTLGSSQSLWHTVITQKFSESHLTDTIDRTESSGAYGPLTRCRSRAH